MDKDWDNTSKATDRGWSPTPSLWAKIAISAPLDIPDISGYQLAIECQSVKAYNKENPVTNQEILYIRFVSNLNIYKIAIVCPGQHHVKA